MIFLMGVKVLHSCDYNDLDCPNAGAEPVELTVDAVVHRGEICPEHRKELAEMLRELGLRPVASISDGKRRDILIAKSGEPFTAAQARTWLVEQGIKTGASSGRVSIAHLDLYAANH